MWARAARRAAARRRAPPLPPPHAPRRALAAAAGPAAERAALAHCASLVRDRDHAAFVWAAQLPPALRAPVFALRAFDLEVAAAADAARGEMAAMLRYQWWRDAVNAAYRRAGAPAPEGQSPVVAALGAAAAAHGLTRYRLQRIVSAREEDAVREGAPPTLAALSAHAEGTAGQLLALQAEAAGGGGGAAAEAAVSAAGRAVGLAAALRDTVPAARRGRARLPADLLERHGVALPDLLAGRVGALGGLPGAAAEVAAAAAAALAEARARRRDVPRAARPMLLPVVAAEDYLRALRAQGHDPFAPALQPRPGGAEVAPLGYQLRVKWRLLRGTY
jgi:NADH dehydrogenase [ubiquinone] 1 alpha subcomplex assembly factor 6